MVVVCVYILRVSHLRSPLQISHRAYPYSHLGFNKEKQTHLKEEENESNTTKQGCRLADTFSCSMEETKYYGEGKKAKFPSY